MSYARRYSILSSFSIPTADNDAISALGWDLPLEEQIKNAETVADLEVLWKRFKPSDDATKELFKKRKGELNG